MDDSITEQFDIRNRFRKRIAARRSYAERMEAMARLQALCWGRLQRSPSGMAQFMRRNFRQRAIDVPENMDAS
jgi:hypothetical protein